MNVLSLFAGIGGLELGLERAGMTVVGQVEIDPFCRRVLAKHWPEVPRHDDVRTAVEWWRGESRPLVDVICGGFPCQDISNAGRREGIAGARSGLWSHMRDTVRALRPRYVVMENVSALLARGLDVVAADLAESGYDLEWDCVPASAVGANHQRDRWFGVAYPQGDGRRPGWPRRSAGDGPDGQAEWPKALADTYCVAGPPPVALDLLAGAEARRSLHRANRRNRGRGGPWAAEPSLGRVANGVPDGVDRIRALGNAVVPQVAEHVGRLIVAAEEDDNVYLSAGRPA